MTQLTVRNGYDIPSRTPASMQIACPAAKVHVLQPLLLASHPSDAVLKTAYAEQGSGALLPTTAPHQGIASLTGTLYILDMVRRLHSAEGSLQKLNVSASFRHVVTLRCCPSA